VEQAWVREALGLSATTEGKVKIIIGVFYMSPRKGGIAKTRFGIITFKSLSAKFFQRVSKTDRSKSLKHRYSRCFQTILHVSDTVGECNT
jgi:hypothetical protein